MQVARAWEEQPSQAEKRAATQRQDADDSQAAAEAPERDLPGEKSTQKDSSSEEL